MRVRLWVFCSACAALLAMYAGSLASVCLRRAVEAEQDIAAPGSVAGVEADNSYCYVCHTNYTAEPFACVHQRSGIGCMACHGSSDTHSADENNITPPDIMYAKARIDSFCDACHLGYTHAQLQTVSTARETCTDCHGKQHQLKVRTRRWDKVTGKLIADDGVRMNASSPKQ